MFASLLLCYSYLLSWNNLIFSKICKWYYCFEWVSNQSFSLQWHLSFTDWITSCHRTGNVYKHLSFYAICTNLFQLNKYDQYLNRPNLMNREQISYSTFCEPPSPYCQHYASVASTLASGITLQLTLTPKLDCNSKLIWSVNNDMALMPRLSVNRSLHKIKRGNSFLLSVSLTNFDNIMPTFIARKTENNCSTNQWEFENICNFINFSNYINCAL